MTITQETNVEDICFLSDFKFSSVRLISNKEITYLPNIIVVDWSDLPNTMTDSDSFKLRIKGLVGSLSEHRKEAQPDLATVEPVEK